MQQAFTLVGVQGSRFGLLFEVQTMKQYAIAVAILAMAALCSAQDTGDFTPAETNVWGAQYPRVDASGRVQIRIKAPDATKARLKVHVLWLGIGTAEPERMREGIRGFHKALTEAGIEHVYWESPGTDHEWQTWRRNLQDFAPRLFH
jgi:hypothetical protein